MRKYLRWTIALIGLWVLLFIGWNLINYNLPTENNQINITKPTYHGKYTTTAVYNSEGDLNYKLMADYVNHYAEQQITWFIQPTVTMFNEDKIPTWSIKADKAKLTKNRMLYLYGRVQLDNLTNISQLKSINTDNAMINLITQDISSDDKVMLFGSSFRSVGMKMRVNLRNKTAELIEKVNTYYEIQHS